MAQNITTLLEKDDAEDISLADLLYLVQGTGSNRDRKMTLEQLRDFLAGAGFDEIKFDKSNYGGHFTNSIDHRGLEVEWHGTGVDEKLEIKAEEVKMSNPENSSDKTLELKRTGMKFSNFNYGGHTETEVSNAGVKVSWDGGEQGSSETEITHEGITTPKISTEKLLLTFDPDGMTGTNASQRSSMTECESESGVGTPTEYFVAVNPGTEGYARRDYFILDSVLHDAGTVVMLRNVGTSGVALQIYRKDDEENRDYPLCEIPAKSTRCFVYHGTESGPSGAIPVWDLM